MAPNDSPARQRAALTLSEPPPQSLSTNSALRALWALRLAAAVPLLIGAFWLTAWFSGAAALWSAGPSATVKTNMALGQFLIGVALFLLTPTEPAPWRHRLGLGAAACVFIIGILTLGEHLFAVDLGIDQLLAKEPPGAVATVSPNRPGPPGSLSLALIGAGLFTLARRRRLAPWFGVATFLVNLVPLVGFAYALEAFYTQRTLTGISWFSVVAFFAAALALLLAHDQSGPVAILRRNDAGGRLFRRSLPALLLLPLLLGFLDIAALRRHWYDTDVGTGLLVLAILVTFTGLLWRTAWLLSRSDQALLRERNLLQAVMDGAKNSHLVFLDRDFNFVRVNDTYARNCGYTPAQMLGLNHFALYPHPENQAIFARVRDSGQPAEFHDKPFQFPDHPERGVTFWDWTLSPIKDHHGSVSGLVFSLFETTSRVCAEVALRESEEKFRAAFANATVGFALTTPDGQYLDINPAYSLLTGYSRDDLRSLSFPHLVHPDDFAPHAALLDDLLAGLKPSFTFEHRYLRKDNQVLWVRKSVSLVRNPDGSPRWVVSLLEDITERKLAEQEARAQRELLQTVVNHLPAAVNLIRGADLRILFANPAYQAIAPGKEMLGKSLNELWPETGADLDQLCRNVLDSGQPYHAVDAPYNIRRSPGGPLETAWFSWSLFRVRLPGDQGWALLNTAWETTQRKQAEEALHQAHQRLQFHLQNTPLAIVEFDADLRVAAWSDGARRIFGWDAAEVIGRPMWDIPWIFEEDRPKIQTISTGLVAGQTPRSVSPNRNLTKDGRVIWCEWYNSTLTDASRKMQSIQSLVLDVTERTQAETALRDAQAQLRLYADNLERLVAERTAKLQELVAELEHFSYTITHDMRAPLRAMRGFAEIIAELSSPNLDDQSRMFLNRIIASAERMDTLITDALSYSKAVRQEVPVAPVDLGKLLRGMLDSYPEFQTPEADISIQEDIPSVMGNEAALTQVFSNLLGNAVKFTHPSRRPHVRVYAETLPAGLIRITVEDNGIGIPESMLPRIFDMFAHGASPQAGTGIGLALVRKVLERMGGKVSVQSDLGQGSRFFVELQPGRTKL